MAARQGSLLGIVAAVVFSRFLGKLVIKKWFPRLGRVRKVEEVPAEETAAEAEDSERDADSSDEHSDK